ncbi:MULTISPECIES: class I SAM-dependent methyltransferase [unclassified Nocardioides]|uniref:class I SAM-dependent methyltransferase n=1 Tax=unclassified Nocardioides TaxID=2615069 RepID=UPI0006F66E31|nr:MULTISPECIES: class I SAM-dependent methyltransferase [unclassified Nocardioides]KQY56936.1 hypothetical protein ASD30_11695 [Nocardioides sp. Root140]KQZ66865.1 hypothetical protein ASD66_17745 [Nocardioides sp. Root151]KRF13058.1 hypothetical protein ASH02_16340 [Nocardioides sp. Soil796]
MAVQTCPACHSRGLHPYPVSRRTGRRNFRCTSCGLVGWGQRDELAPVETVGLDTISVEQREAWFQLKRDGVTAAAWAETLDELSSRLGLETGAGQPKIYDIGAGDGAFLDFARSRGYDVGGNELLEAAIEIARSKFDIDLDLGDLSALDLPAANDAVTLWCVLAHVPSPDELLDECFSLLKPGGVLFLQTPYRCTIDAMALGALRASRGRVSRWVDRRIAQHHWLLHTRRSMTVALERAGFVDVQVTPQARYSLQAAPYLASLGLKGRGGEVVSKGVDRLLDKGLAPRIVLDVYARRPLAATPGQALTA